MPIYEYQCKQCGVFEVTQRITENPLSSCPTCGSAVHRLISHTSFVLKGSGWYATDYARANGKTEGAGETTSKEAPTSTSADKPAPAAPESKGDSGESSKSTSDKSVAAKATD